MQHNPQASDKEVVDMEDGSHVLLFTPSTAAKGLPTLQACPQQPNLIALIALIRQILISLSSDSNLIMNPALVVVSHEPTRGGRITRCPSGHETPH